jgi:hypothetical protein
MHLFEQDKVLQVDKSLTQYAQQLRRRSIDRRGKQP